MLRTLKYPSLALAVCLIAVPPARAEGEKTENKGDGKAVIAVFTFDKPIMEKPHGEEFPLFSKIDRTSLKDVVERMKKAKDDTNVKAVVLLLDEVDLGSGAMRGASPGPGRDQGGGQGGVRPRRRGLDDAVAGAGWPGPPGSA